MRALRPHSLLKQQYLPCLKKICCAHFYLRRTFGWKDSCSNSFAETIGIQVVSQRVDLSRYPRHQDAQKQYLDPLSAHQNYMSLARLGLRHQDAVTFVFQSYAFCQ